MRRRPDQAAVGFTARIQSEDRARLDANLPMTGGKTWAVQAALEYFCSLCESDQALQSRVHDAVLQMRAGEPPRQIEELVPQVPLDLYKRFNRMFGEKGATTWFLRSFVSAFNKRMAMHPGIDTDVKEAVRTILGLPEGLPFHKEEL